MKKYLYTAVALATAASPYMVGAQDFDEPSTNLGPIENLIRSLIDIGNLLIRLAIIAAVVVFFFGVVRYVLASDPDSKDKAKTYILYGLLGTFIILTFWGIIIFFAGVFGFRTGAGVEGLSPDVTFEDNTTFNDGNDDF